MGTQVFSNFAIAKFTKFSLRSNNIIRYGIFLGVECNLEMVPRKSIVYTIPVEIYYSKNVFINYMKFLNYEIFDEIVLNGRTSLRFQPGNLF